jgi:hypothetical protein
LKNVQILNNQFLKSLYLKIKTKTNRKPNKRMKKNETKTNIEQKEKKTRKN